MVADTRLYEILTVLPGASTVEISKAYKKLALKFHPDKTNHDPNATEKFKELSRAYEVLKEPRTRRVYDSFGEPGLQGNVSHPSSQRANSSHHYSSAPDIFAQMFNEFNQAFAGHSAIFEGMDPFNMSGRSSRTHMRGGAFGFGAQDGGEFEKYVTPADVSKPRLSRGMDIHHQFKVTLSDLYYGKNVMFRLPKNSACKDCDGAGGKNAGECSQCKGRGKILITLVNSVSNFQEIKSCDSCHGTGIYVEKEGICITCNGSGYCKENKLINVTIIPGSKNGDKIILKKQADEARNIIPGDLIIELIELNHSRLIRRDNDLHMKMGIDLRTALLGGSVVVEDFVNKGQNLTIYLNAHGQAFGQSETEIKQFQENGEIIGIVKPGEPMVVRNLGMPINNARGAYIQTATTQEEINEILDTTKYHHGDLIINFTIKMPAAEDFVNGVTDFAALDAILPGKNDRFVRGGMHASVSKAPLDRKNTSNMFDSYNTMNSQSPVNPRSASVESGDLDVIILDDDDLSLLHTEKRRKRGFKGSM